MRRKKEKMRQLYDTHTHKEVYTPTYRTQSRVAARGEKCAGEQVDSRPILTTEEKNSANNVGYKISN